MKIQSIIQVNLNCKHKFPILVKCILTQKEAIHEEQNNKLQWSQTFQEYYIHVHLCFYCIHRSQSCALTYSNIFITFFDIKALEALQ